MSDQSTQTEISQEAAHTPGPWRVEQGTTLIWGACSPDDLSCHGMGFPVAEARVRLPVWARPPARLDEDVAEANARLIAAAPDMLAALKSASALLAIVQHEEDDEEGRRLKAAWDCDVAEINAAIAKAECGS